MAVVDSVLPIQGSPRGRRYARRGSFLHARRRACLLPVLDTLLLRRNHGMTNTTGETRRQLSGLFALMAKVPFARKDHGYCIMVRHTNSLLIAYGATWLNN